MRELALQAAHSPAGECRSGLQTARRCCLFDALHPAPVPDADSVPAESQPKQKAHRKDELFVLLVETAGIEPASASTLQIVLHT